MKTILLFGAGKSSTVLIDYLISEAAINNWKIIVADADKNLIVSKIKNSIFAEAIQIEISNSEQRVNLIQNASIVISMMPPALHFLIAKDCVTYCKNLLTASYVDEQIKKLQSDIENNKLLFLCEMGLDPGIDHMSAMKLIDEIKSKGGKINSFKSHCGGLVAPESDNNPWHYKISWNSRNIVLAGNAGAVYKENNKIIKKQYHQIFENCGSISFTDLYALAWYPNRNSLSYISTYKLEEASTFIRTTLRHPSFCHAWDYIVNLGLTDIEDHDNIIDCETFVEWLQRKLFLVEDREMGLEEYVDLYVHEDFAKETIEQFIFLGLTSTNKLSKTLHCSADILQHLVETKLDMNPTEKDMIVMLHEIEYEVGSINDTIQSYLKVIGDNSLKTAMAKTVGLPLGIAAKLILNGTILLTGLQIPTAKEIYLPVLKELELFDIKFTSKANQ